MNTMNGVKQMSPAEVAAIETIKDAQRVLGRGSMVSSAQTCLSNAVAALERGEYQVAQNRALKSLAYSVGILHQTYRACYEHCRSSMPVLDRLADLSA